MRLEFLPPYSPDFNPIELAFSIIKSRLKRDGALFRAASESQAQRAQLLAHLHQVVWSIDSTIACNLYHHTGYV